MNKITLKKILGQTYIWLILLFMYLPILVVIAWSFTTADIGSWALMDNPFQIYVDLFTTMDGKNILKAVGNTVIIAVISAVVSTVLGTMGAIGAFYSRKKARNTVDMMTQIPLVNAEIVVAFSLTVMFVFLGSKIFGGANLFSFWTLLIGHVSLSIPFVYTSVKPKLQQMDPSLYEAALDLGCSPRKAMRKVMIPEIMPGILSGFLLSVTLSLDDFIITAFTRGAGLLSGKSNIETISTYVQAQIKKNAMPIELRSLTTLIFLAVVIAVILITIYKSKMGNKKKVRKGRD